jgi:predicted aldo/keto reductase-like oxidoreductase
MKMIDKPVASSAELALRFVLSNPGVSAALSGMNTIQMVEENAATASIKNPLKPEERRQVMVALEEKKKLASLYCTGCRYCMPCPNGVDISGNFNLMSYYLLYDLRGYARKQYERLGQRKVEGVLKPAWAAACQECGDCEEKCPQNIEIRKQLKETQEALAQRAPRDQTI